MQLRNHPLMLYRGRRNWPPAWVWTGAGLDEHPRGEVGSLHDIQIFKVDHRVVLLMAWDDVPYIGCLRFDDPAASRQIGAILKRQIGRSIKEIGDLDLTALLAAATPEIAAPLAALRAAAAQAQARKQR
jgi:hypothetical protein